MGRAHNRRWTAKTWRELVCLRHVYYTSVTLGGGAVGLGRMEWLKTVLLLPPILCTIYSPGLYTAWRLHCSKRYFRVVDFWLYIFGDALKNWRWIDRLESTTSRWGQQEVTHALFLLMRCLHYRACMTSKLVEHVYRTLRKWCEHTWHMCDDKGGAAI